ncbi:polysaccharide deacetylase family protein [Actinopolymorpha pittospori]|uniref:Peptidoglycan/xylan/chitin deacetylase (PgdA/CDA1 family) n=1 Tax=Actinopolymorpha pittospori TaxID=648752 RepID=A0A927RJR8_9ACTN|nr:polysaccharide deacetylase family protein [Actinopolymorpha pittospori]MBE1605943.1 peptidoglycan/xylan/chitin deacetylase (PgdA/CDA1 family) [Actinopolymorpha pittospori]
MTRRLAVAAGAAGVLAAGAVVADLLPAAGWLPPIRRILPTLAGRGDSRHVALTFDDGPHPVATPLILERLSDLDARATFFLLAEQVLRDPGVVAAIHAGGHEIAVHGLRHDLPTRPWRDRAELTEAYQVISEAAGYRPNWFRPTYGFLTASRYAAARRLGLRPVLWTVAGRDWLAHRDAHTVSERVVRHLTGGDTVLLHDSDVSAAPGCWRATLHALDRIVDHCDASGWSVGPLGEHGLPNPPDPAPPEFRRA